jgi:hypothetical protein
MWYKVGATIAMYGGGWIPLLPIPIVFAATLFGRRFGITGSWPNTIAFGAIIASAVGFTRRLVGGRAAQRAAKRIIPLVLKEGLCPSCTYNLHDLPTQPDGCVMCPECGTAWKRTRIERTGPIPERFDKATGAGPSILRSSVGSVLSARDGRGVRQPLMPRTESPSEVARDSAHLAALREIQARYPSDTSFVRIIGALVLAFIATSWLTPLFDATSIHRYGLGWFIIRAVPSAVFYAGALLLLLSGVGKQQRRLITLMVQKSLCPTCGDQLPTAPAQDGCLECPTCGAAWKPAPHNPRA